MTSSEFQAEFDSRVRQGYRLIEISGYSVDDEARYAAIFENDLIDSKIQAYMKEHAIPGISIAITKQERLVFAKGYGYADTSTKERIHRRHRFRIASISKPITALLLS